MIPDRVQPPNGPALEETGPVSVELALFWGDQRAGEGPPPPWDGSRRPTMDDWRRIAHPLDEALAAGFIIVGRPEEVRRARARLSAVLRRPVVLDPAIASEERLELRTAQLATALPRLLARLVDEGGYLNEARFAGLVLATRRGNPELLVVADEDEPATEAERCAAFGFFADLNMRPQPGGALVVVSLRSGPELEAACELLGRLLCRVGFRANDVLAGSLLLGEGSPEVVGDGSCLAHPALGMDWRIAQESAASQALERGDYDAAIAHYEASLVLTVASDSEAGVRSPVSALLRVGRFADARALLARWGAYAREGEAADVRAWLDLGEIRALAGAGRTREARDVLAESGLDTAGIYARDSGAVVSLYETDRDWAGLEGFLRAGSEGLSPRPSALMDPNTPWVQTVSHRIGLLRGGSRPLEATERVERALHWALEVGDEAEASTCRNELAEAAEQRQDFDAAKALWHEIVVSGGAEAGRAARRLAWLLERRGELEEAVTWNRRFGEILPEYAGREARRAGRGLPPSRESSLPANSDRDVTEGPRSRRARIPSGTPLSDSLRAVEGGDQPAG